MDLKRIWRKVIVCAFTLLFTGGIAAHATSPVISGQVRAGFIGVNSGTVTAYSVGTSGPTTLASTTTDTSGNFGFNSAGKPTFSCATGDAIYFVATDVVPHSYTHSGSTPVSLFASPGVCQSIGTVVLNELTTAAGMLALNDFAYDSSTYSVDIHYGANITQFAAANALVGQLVSPTTGFVPGSVPSGYTYSADDQAKVRSIGDALHTCAAADPAAGTGTGTPCGTLFSASVTTPGLSSAAPTNTLSAMINIAKYRSTISAIGDLVGTGPFTPTWTALPADLIPQIQASTGTPTITVNTVTGLATVTIACSTPGATIWYTSDGTTPTIGGGTSSVYLSPVTFFTSKTIKAIAQEFGRAPSTVSIPNSFSVTGGPHLLIVYGNRPIQMGSSTTGTVALSSGTPTGTINVTVTSPVPNALSFNAITPQATTTVTLSPSSPTANFTIYGLSAGTALVTATDQASVIAPGTFSLRSLALNSGNTVSSKSPIHGFSAVNGQNFNNVSEPYPKENDANQITIDHPGFAGSVINVTWGNLEPSSGSFDFSTIESAITAIKAANTSGSQNVVAKLRVWAGINVPDWLRNGEPDGLGGTGVYMSSIGTDHHAVHMAMSWSADYEANFKSLMTALAAEYDQRDIIQEMVVSPCTANTDEPYVVNGLYMYSGWTDGTVTHPSMQAAGYTDAAHRQCLEDAGGDYNSWTITPLYLPFNALLNYDSGQLISYPGFAFQQMQAFAAQKLGQAIIANQDLQPVSCLNDPSCASSGPIFSMFPYVTYTVGGTTYPAHVGAQIIPGGAKFETKCAAFSTDYACYDSFIQWAEDLTMSGFKATELELYPTNDSTIPSPTGTDTNGSTRLTGSDIQSLAGYF